MQKILYDAMLSRIKKEIISNKEEIKKLEEIDNKYSKNKIQLENITKIIEYYKTKPNIQAKPQNKKVSVKKVENKKVYKKPILKKEEKPAKKKAESVKKEQKEE